MTAFSDFLAMGGYGAYVWPAYAVAVIVVAVLWRTAAVRKKRAWQRLQRLYRAGGRQ